MSVKQEENWKVIQSRSQDKSPSELVGLWQDCFQDWNVETQGPTPIWFPNEQDLEQSNVARWTTELGFSKYSEFHRWSVENRPAFWDQGVAKLGIRFTEPPTQTLDGSQGIAKPAWFVGGKMNIADSCFQSHPDDIAMIAQAPGGPLRQISYKELRQQASQVANSLADHGFKVGDAIAVLMPMTSWSVAIYLGIVMAGCNVVSIADSFAPPEIAIRLNIAGAKAAFTYDHQLRAGKKLPLFRKLAEASDIPAIVLTQEETLSVDLRDQDHEWSEFISDRTEFESVACTVNETINILFSSGTTGDPKAIPWSHLTPIRSAIDGYCHQNIQPKDVVAWPTNLGWMMGPWLIFASLINRATIALYEDAPVGPGFGEFIQDAKVTMLGVVPTIVKAWQSSGDMESYDWSAIKVFSSTGESSQANTMVYLSALAGIKPIIEYCGGTEIGGGYVTSVVTLPNFPAAFNTPAVGLDFILIEQSEDEPIDSAAPSVGGNEGEVFLVPPSIGLSVRLVNRDHFETYYAGTPNVDGQGQLRRHGDYFRRLSSDYGDVFVAGGRADDTMNLGGIKTSSAEIERVLNQVVGVVETAAVSYSKSGGPSELFVFVVTDDEAFENDEAAKLKEMNGLLKSRLNPLFRIRKLILIDAMPRTASGKVMRRKLRDHLKK